ncbi:MAG: hypothetical protein IPK15_27425 [Verrucomicrobia bacterium]|nr:hypothetical protein [Verrucomicrobiota bacterium]
MPPFSSPEQAGAVSSSHGEDSWSSSGSELDSAASLNVSRVASTPLDLA